MLLKLHATLLICLLPLLYINVKSSFDWGDDYAQYLVQAKNLTTPSQVSTQVVGLEHYSPAYRPAGFPLLLYPVYKMVGLSPYALLFFNNLLFLLLCLVVYQFFESELKATTAFIITLVFAYTPYLLRLKSELIPEITFTLILYFGMYFICKPGNYSVYTNPVVTPLLILFKYIGILFMAALIFRRILFHIEMKRKYGYGRSLRGNLRFIFFNIIIPLVLYFIINHFVCNIPLGSESWYNRLIDVPTLLSTIGNNFIYYKDVFLNSFEQELPHFANVILRTIVAICFFLGIINTIFYKNKIWNWFFIFYVGVLLVYPYTKGGYRFILPIVPICLIYICGGVNVFIEILFRRKPSLRIAFFFMILVSFTINVKNIIAETPDEQSGPQEKEFVEVRDYMATHFDSTQCVMFTKPWVLGLYGNTRVMAVTGNDNEESFPEALKKHHANAVLAAINPYHELYDKNLLNLITIDGRFEEVFKNESFGLFVKKDSSK